MNWLTYSVIALVTFSGYDLLSRHIGVQSKNPRAFSAVYYFMAAILMPLLLIVEPVPAIQLTGSIVILTIFGLLAWILFGRIEFITHKYVEASVLTILLRLGPIITFILSVQFLGESMTAQKVSALVLTLVASMLVIGLPTPAMLGKSKGLGYGIMLALILGVAWTFDKILSPVYGVIVFGIMTFLAPAIVNAFVPPLRWSVMRQEVRRASWKMLVLGAMNIVGYAAMTKALILGDATNVIPIATSTPPLVVLGGAILLRERKDLWKKCVATVLVVIAIYLSR